MSIAYLKKAKDFGEVHDSIYFKTHFVEKYINNIPLMALELFNIELTYQQIEVLDAIDWAGGHVVVPSGHGCHGIDTPIMMFDGQIKKVQHIKVGDLLMGDDGKTPRKVLSLASGKEELYEFEYNNGIKRVYNKSHILPLYHQCVHGDITITVEDFIKDTEALTEERYFDDYGTYVYLRNQDKHKEIKIEDVTHLGVGDYYGFELDGNHKFLDGDFIVQHNTGKTKLIGVIATAFILLFKRSIVRIQAPKSEQVTKFSFKEINSCLEAIWSPRKLGERNVISKWAFLKKFFQINTGSIYIKKFQKSWYIEPATAPKGDPTNLSGQHNWAYLLIFDEMSGIPDSHIQGSLGALSEEINSCVGFSQHTNTTGMFHNFVTTQSKEMGGVWDVVRLNSEQSPRVTKKSIISWRATYTENEYNVRVLGLPPLYEDGFLIDSEEALSVYSKKGKDWIDELVFDTLTVSSDVAYRGFRDSGSTVEMEISAQKDTLGRTILYIILKDIDVFQGKTAKLPIKLAMHAFKKMLNSINKAKGKYTKLKQVIDASAGGHEAYTELREKVEDSGLENISVTGVTWGSKRMGGMDKRRFFNQRAKAYVMLQEAIFEGRFYIATNKYKTRVLNELSHIPFSFTEDLKYKMMLKEEMRKISINSPDVVDAIAQQFIAYYEVSEASDSEFSSDEEELGDEFEDADLDEVEEEFSEEEFDMPDETLLGETIL